jgi:chemotaxis protein CheD
MSAAVRPDPDADPATPVAALYLHPGEIHVTSQPTRLTTILGSCVSVCLFDARARVAGMNHFLLPRAPATGDGSTRYGDIAMDVLVARMLTLGASRDRMIAKLFGGANVLRAFGEGELHIGLANVELARAALERQSIAVGAEDVGGTRGRKLVFDAPDGAAWVKVIGP